MSDVVILSTRVPPATVMALDAKRGSLTRAEAMRRAIEVWSDPTFTPPPPTARAINVARSLHRDEVEPTFKARDRK
jgi:hypothetical protein